MIELILNGVNIDLTGNEDVALSFAASKLQDIKSRNGDFSTTFKVPLTNDVKQAIDYSNNFTSNSSFPYRVAEAEIRESGVTVMRGFARIEKIASELEVNVFSGNSNWFDLIREKELQDLNLSDLNITFNEANVEANRLNDYTKGFCFPNAWYGKFASDSKPFWLYDFFPAVYCHRILKQIFEDIGWVVEGDLFEEDLFNKAALPFSNDNLGSDNVLFGQSGIDLITFLSVTGSSAGFIEIDTPTIDPLEIINPAVASGTIGSAASFIISDKNIYIISGLFTFNISTIGTTFVFKLVNKATGAIIADIGNSSVVSTGLNATGFLFEGSLEPGEYCIHVVVNYTGGLGLLGTRYIRLRGVENFHFKRNLLIGQTLIMAYSLPKSTKQIDFILTIVNQFNIIIRTEQGLKKAIFNKFNSVVDGKAKAIDWSRKADLKNAPEFINLPDIYGKQNYFRYKNDSGDNLIDEKELGDWYFEIDNSNLPDKVDIISSVFAASNRQFIWAGVDIELISIPLRQNTISPRIGVIKITNNNIIAQFGQATPTQSAEVFFSELSFEKLIPKYYSGLVVAFNRFKMIRLYLNLTAADINQIDYMKPIYLHFTSDWIGQVNGYFYLNLVDQYKPGAGETTLVELVRI